MIYDIHNTIGESFMKKYKSTVFNVTGMHCTACANRIEKKLSMLDGIQHCTVNFALGTAHIQYISHITSETNIIKSVESIGFKLSPKETSTNDDNKDLRPIIIKVVISWILTFILTLPMIFHQFSFLHTPIFGVIIAGLTIFGPGFPIIKSAISSLISGVLGMDVLIALGSLAAWISALLPLFGINIPNYSMTAAMLIAVNLTGRLLETIARGTASKAVSALANFTGKTAHKMIANGETIDVPIIELKIGDTVQIKAGEKIPTDGTIISGRTSTDESFLTGESLPIEKQEGDYIYGASLNLDGFIIMEVKKEANDSLLAQTIRLIQEAQGTKVPIQILADKITGFFVPIILTLSFLSFAIWFAFPDYFPNLLTMIGIDYTGPSRLASAISAGIAVLVIACPCALGLATPMALVNGSTLGAKKGILIRRGAAVQNLTSVNVIALDKTGTLTMGKPKLMSITTESSTEKESLAILAGLEEISTHPLALAITNHAKTNHITSITLTDTSNKPGQGVSGYHQNIEWFAGSLKATLELEIHISETLLAKIDYHQNIGETLICLSNRNTQQCEAIVSFADKINPEAKESIRLLKELGNQIIMITGDHKNAAMTVANELEITSVIAECSPKQKLEAIQSLQKQQYKVCFVGDGINDVAALEAADVGIAIGTGTDIAAEAGDLILITGSLTSLVLSFKLAKETFKKIKQNLFWAFFYNIIAIPLAFLGLLHPVVAEIAMSFSSLTVIGNSILLSHKKL